MKLSVSIIQMKGEETCSVAFSRGGLGLHLAARENIEFVSGKLSNLFRFVNDYRSKQRRPFSRYRPPIPRYRCRRPVVSVTRLCLAARENNECVSDEFWVFLRDEG